MKLGFVDSIFNAYDVYGGVQELAGQKFANLQLARATVPDVLKVPAASKKLLDPAGGGCDAVLVFLTPGDEDRDALYLVYEKIIDVEISTGKYVIFCMVPQDEFKDDESFAKAADAKLELALDLVNKTASSNPTALSKDIGSDAFAAFAQMSAAVAPGATDADAGNPGEFNPMPALDDAPESGKSIF